jgi:predicted transcriptional regulator
MNAIEAARVSLRLPVELKERVWEMAEANHRSLTREIEHALSQHVAKPAEEPSR